MRIFKSRSDVSGDGAEKCKPLFSDKQFIFTDILCSAENLVELATKSMFTSSTIST